MSYVVRFAECGADVDRVGGKCASLGTLTEAGLAVPPGFAITTAAFAETLAAAGLDREVQEAVAGADPADIQELNEMSARVRERIESAPVPAAIEAGIRTAYDELA
jgi:pyruvate, water dikinase